MRKKRRKYWGKWTQLLLCAHSARCMDREWFLQRKLIELTIVMINRVRRNSSFMDLRRSFRRRINGDWLMLVAREKSAMDARVWAMSSTWVMSMRVERHLCLPGSHWLRTLLIYWHMLASGIFSIFQEFESGFQFQNECKNIKEMGEKGWANWDKSEKGFIYLLIATFVLFCRSLSCELHLGKNGVCYFGDEVRGHVLSHAFTLQDAQVKNVIELRLDTGEW